MLLELRHGSRKFAPHVPIDKLNGPDSDGLPSLHFWSVAEPPDASRKGIPGQRELLSHPSHAGSSFFNAATIELKNLL